MQPTLKASGTKRLILQYDRLLSSVAFKFKLRRYTKAAAAEEARDAAAAAESAAEASLSAMTHELQRAETEVASMRALLDVGPGR